MSVRLLAWCLAPVALALPATLVARTPLLVIGDTGDTWEKQPADFEAEVQGLLRRQPIRLCDTLDESQVLLLTSADAIARLDAASVVALDDRSDTMVPPGRSAAGLYAETLQEMEARRHAALVDRQGSWSQFDQQQLERVRSLIESRQVNSYRPYLVRAFKWSDRQTRAQVSICGRFVRTTVHEAGVLEPGARPKPLRAAALVFLPTAPTESFAQWIADVIPVPADWDSAPMPELSAR